ncbi:MAG: peptidyl-prolyl cis-trans isomerase [Cyclobacteriaceae bacterium]
MKSYILIFFSIAFIFSACDLINFKREQAQTDSERPLARVNNIYLYPHELEGLLPENISAEDSIQRVSRHIKSWIKKQLLISEAQNTLKIDETELERKVLDYKYALIVHEFEKLSINQKIDANITQEEIKAYYSENLENFELKQNIIRCNYVKLPTSAPRINRFKTLLNSNKPDDREELRSYCFRFADKTHLEDSVWLNFEEIITSTPLFDMPNKVEFLRRNKNVNVTDGDYIHFLKILEYRISKQTSPLEFVTDDIEKILLNKRKIKLANDLERDIYEKAERNKSFEIYEAQ